MYSQKEIIEYFTSIELKKYALSEKLRLVITSEIYRELSIKLSNSPEPTTSSLVELKEKVVSEIEAYQLKLLTPSPIGNITSSSIRTMPMYQSQ